jgi:hypothetical protein
MGRIWGLGFVETEMREREHHADTGIEWREEEEGTVEGLKAQASALSRPAPW